MDFLWKGCEEIPTSQETSEVASEKKYEPTARLVTEVLIKIINYDSVNRIRDYIKV